MLATSAQSGQNLCASLRKSVSTNSMKFCKDCKYFNVSEDKSFKGYFNAEEIKQKPPGFFNDWGLSICTHERTSVKDENYIVNGWLNMGLAKRARMDPESCGVGAVYYEEL